MREGDGIRYRGLGAGRVTQILTRKFQGEQAEFAVIFFPHRQMNAQVPIEDEAVKEKLSPLLSQRKLNTLLRQLKPGCELGKTLPRTWDAREEWGRERLVSGGPDDWLEILASYALAESSGVEILASDQDLIDSALELLASELCCLSGGQSQDDYDQSFEEIKDRYKSAAKLLEGVSEGETHFASVGRSAA